MLCPNGKTAPSGTRTLFCCLESTYLSLSSIPVVINIPLARTILVSIPIQS